MLVVEAISLQLPVVVVAVSSLQSLQAGFVKYPEYSTDIDSSEDGQQANDVSKTNNPDVPQHGIHAGRLTLNANT